MTDSPEVMQRLRRTHTRAVLDELRRSGGLSRAELVRRSGLSRNTLSAILSDLSAQGAVIERAPAASEPRGRGRPVNLVSLNPLSGVLLGVDIAQREVSVVVLNVAHEVIASARERVPERAGTRRCVNVALRLVEGLVTEHHLRLEGLEAVGLGMAGVVWDASGAGAAAPAGQAKKAVAMLEERFGVPVLADNTSRLGALAEATWGAAVGVDSMVYVRWSDGVGGGVLIGGRLVEGVHGIAGQLGHVVVDPNETERCGCGGYGCLDPLIRIPTLLTEAIEAGADVADAGQLFALARAGDPVVCRVFTDAAWTLGVALASLVVHVDPARVVVGGEVAELGDLVLDQVRAAIRRHALPNAPRPIEVVPAELGPERSALGAVARALHRRDLATVDTVGPIR